MQVNLLEAIRLALAHALQEDPNVLLYGEDIGGNGGVFRATLGLQEQFGKHRVFDTPLAENMLAGIAVGMSVMGLKPIVEIQFLGFIYSALEQIAVHASRMRNRTHGRLSCPMVIRAPYGAGIHAPEHHSESIEAIFCHIPGLRVVIPSSPQQAYGLLLAAIDDPDPVIFLEPTRLYRFNREEIIANHTRTPLDTCFLLREGHDVTVVSWGSMLIEVMQAASIVQEQYNTEVEVIDVATLKPLDINTILQSVSKTGNLIVVHEAQRTCGLGAEIVALVSEHGLQYLKSPIQRITGYDTIIPLYQLESFYLPTVNKIVNAIKCLEHTCI